MSPAHLRFDGLPSKHDNNKQTHKQSDFYRGDAISSVNLAGLDHVVSISASQEGKIYFRVYLIHLKKSGTRMPRIEVEEMGPSIDFELRRFQLASKEVMHEALKVPRTLKVKITLFFFQCDSPDLTPKPQTPNRSHSQRR